MKDDKEEFRILIIDDNPAIHQDFIKILKSNSGKSELNKLNAKIFGGEAKSEIIAMPLLQIDTALQGEEGFEKVKTALKEGRPYALAFVDIRMPPGWDGIDTIKKIWNVDTDIQIVICTAYSDYTWEETVSNLGQTDNLLILKKPFDNVAVRQIACALTKKWKLLKDKRNYELTLEQKIADRTDSLNQTLSLVKATLESSNDGILVLDMNQSISDFNQKFTSMWRIPIAIVEAKDNVKLFEYMKTQIENPDEFFKELNLLASDPETVRLNLIHFKDGRIFEYYTQPQKVNNKTIGRIFDFRDITNRAQLEEKLQHQASHDYLTGLPNRLSLIEKLRDLIIHTKDQDNGFSLMFIDLDRFKIINDSLGHSVGDELLCLVAKRLQTTLSQYDMLARLGGDEFVILLPKLNKATEVTDLANKILVLFNKPYQIESRDVTVTVSIGISMYPKDGELVDLLLKNADVAMYQAKELKGGTFQFFSKDMATLNLSKLDNEIELRKAIENKEFFLCYQPQFNLDTEIPVAVEALIRWNHPTKGVLFPDQFIPLAEETGLIFPIGEWVLRTACIQAKQWEKMTRSPIRMAVNVTQYQLLQPQFIQSLKNILNETKLNPSNLELELTENIVISNLDIINTMNEIKKLGVTIAIDDFGTGYSSLGYLKTLPLDRLKIDKSFIQHIKNEQDDEIIVRAIIAIAKNLKMEVLAEGVETKIQLNFLKKHECGDVQGFYFSKPLTVDELNELFLGKVALSKIIAESIDK